MKRIAWWLLIFLLWTVKDAAAQDPNPQTSFSATVLLANPSLYLNFNDLSYHFMDQISGLSFGSTTVPTVAGSLPIPTASWGSASVGMIGQAFGGSGNLQTIKLQFFVAPTAGTAFTICILTGSGTSYTIVDSFTVTVAATTAVQTFTSGTDYPTTAITAGEHLGFWTATSGADLGKNPSIGSTNYYLNSQSTLPSGAQTYSTFTGGPDLQGIVMGTQAAGTIVPRQPGFDSTQINNTSAEVPYNGWNAAPNSTLGTIDWNTPWTMMVHVDRLNWNRTGTLVLASKGDISSVASNWWELTLTMSGMYSQLCFTRNGVGGPLSNSSGSGNGGASNSICTSGFDAMPNGFNYNIIIEDNGTGAPGYQDLGAKALSLYLNGLLVIGSAQSGGQIPGLSASTTYGVGFGAWQITVTAGGTGYANSTAYTVTCPGTAGIAGTFAASGGVMTTGTSGVSETTNYGCSGTPAVVLTSPTGIGATFSYQAVGAYSMNDANYPLLVPGYVSAGVYTGIDGADSTQTASYVDEFAIFPGLSQTAIQSIFYWSKFYQGGINLAPTNRVAFIFSDDTCGDLDDLYALQGAIAAQKLGYLKIEGVEANNDNGPGAAIFQQTLDQAGLGNIRVATPGTGGVGYSGWCNASYITQYNASTPQNYAAYQSSTTMFRTVLANNPTTPVMIFAAGWLTGIAQFMASSADSISPLTGLQLLAQDAANGGAMYLQGGPPCNAPTYCLTTSTTTGDNVLDDPTAGQYVMANHGAMPMYMMSGTPQNSGPGPLYTRTRNDPMYLGSLAYGSDIRFGWDSLPMARLLSNLFWGGAYVSYSGGTGYANSTPFTFSGGGTGCAGSGIMTASGGVPNGITYNFGGAQQAFEGIGNGCLSAPMVNLIGATGIGVTLTAYPTHVCVTDRVTYTGGVWYDGVNSTTCDNQYAEPMSQYAVPSYAPIYQDFLNGLYDPPTVGAPKVQ